MTAVTTASSVFSTFRHALETNDAQEVIDVYAEDAVLVAYSERNRPGAAKPLEGRAAIAEMVRDVVSRNLEHQLGDEVIGEDRFACVERCRYPTGELVVMAMICDVRAGKIVRQVGVEAWDE